VATVFTPAEWVRTPQQVVESLFGPERSPRVGENPPPRPEHKRGWASLTKGKAAVIGEVAAEVLRRDPHGDKKHVVLTDGERALQILVSQKLQITLLLDLLHVLEKLWKAAYVFHAEGSVEAELWVRLRAEKILQGHSSQVVQGIRQTVTKHAFRGSKRKTLTAVAYYLHRNRDRMHYDRYLAHGVPIASGPVEGACKNLIKDRMERSGMRWTEAMAAAIVKLRAIYLSGDFDQYWPFISRKTSNGSIRRGSGSSSKSSHTHFISQDATVAASKFSGTITWTQAELSASVQVRPTPFDHARGGDNTRRRESNL
jgi:hypothetical protein